MSDESLIQLQRYLGPLTPVGAPEMSRLAAAASRVMSTVRDQTIEPNQRKTLRDFSMIEAADILGIGVKALQRKISSDKDFPQGSQVRKNSSRRFSLVEIHKMMSMLGLTPRRGKGDECQVIVVANFKGGSAKTSTAVHLAQSFALRGYKTALIDGDPQATLTAVHGLRPNEINDEMTLMPLIEGDSATLENAIQQTYWDGLDLIAANLQLFAAESVLPNKQSHDTTYQYYDVLRQGLETIKKDYDVIVMDTSPSLSYLTTNLVYAADGLLIPLPPAMYDFESSASFMQSVAETIDAFDRHSGVEKTWKWMRILITKDERQAVQETLKSWIRKTYGEYVLGPEMANSAAIQGAGSEMRTLYELDTYEGSRSTYKRALEFLNPVNLAIERLVRAQWPSHRAKLLQELREEEKKRSAA